MSIWGSGTDCGEDDHGERDGSVLNYINGFSNHYPDTPMTEGRCETTAAVGTAWIPPWCVPGHRDTSLDNGEAHGQWLRLDVDYNNVSVYTGEMTVGEPSTVSVVLREDAVRTLRDSLTSWLGVAKLDGKEAAE